MAIGRTTGSGSTAENDLPLRPFAPTDATRAIDEAIAYLCKQLNAQYVNFLDEQPPKPLERRTFQRYIIPVVCSYAEGQWQSNDDVELVFLTDDSQKRWAEVVVEALNIEVHKSELNEMSKTTEQDLSRATLNREASGARSRFWHLRHSSPAMCRVTLEYIGIEDLKKGNDTLSLLCTGDTTLPEWKEVSKECYHETLEATRRLRGWMIELCNGTYTHPPPNRDAPFPSLESRLPAVELNTGSDATVPPASSPANATPSSSSQRFRDARSALNRLRHDARHADVEYDVGYEDRFEGMKWMSLADWGGKRTEEDDFIPEHRVRVIVRAKDTFVVWNRELRIDRTDGEDA